MKAQEILKGFNALKEGRIHLHCYQCGRKQSNMHKEELDPPTAVMLSMICDKHGDDSDPCPTYYNKEGQVICIPCNGTGKEDKRDCLYCEGKGIEG